MNEKIENAPWVDADVLSRPLPAHYCEVTPKTKGMASVSAGNMIAHLNATLGPGAWRQEILSKEVSERRKRTNPKGEEQTVIAARATVRVTVHAHSAVIVREGLGHAVQIVGKGVVDELLGEGNALKSAVSDAMKRACYTLGKAYGGMLGGGDGSTMEEVKRAEQEWLNAHTRVPRAVTEDVTRLAGHMRRVRNDEEMYRVLDRIRTRVAYLEGTQAFERCTRMMERAAEIGREHLAQTRGETRTDVKAEPSPPADADAGPTPEPDDPPPPPPPAATGEDPLDDLPY